MKRILVGALPLVLSACLFTAVALAAHERESNMRFRSAAVVVWCNWGACSYMGSYDDIVNTAKTWALLVFAAFNPAWAVGAWQAFRGERLVSSVLKAGGLVLGGLISSSILIELIFSTLARHGFSSNPYLIYEQNAYAAWALLAAFSIPMVGLGFIAGIVLKRRWVTA